MAASFWDDGTDSDITDWVTTGIGAFFGGLGESLGMERGGTEYLPITIDNSLQPRDVPVSGGTDQNGRPVMYGGISQTWQGVPLWVWLVLALVAVLVVVQLIR